MCYKMSLNLLSFLFSLYPGVLEEAEFYNITSLIKLVKDRMRDRDTRNATVGAMFVCLFVGNLGYATVSVQKKKSHWISH